MNYPILYSLQHCPYAMRARMGILLADQGVRLRAIVLKNKPKEMLKVSPKGTVPILVIENEPKFNNDLEEGSIKDCKVIDESLDIMLWALTKNDPGNLLLNHQPAMFEKMMSFIRHFDGEFKSHLEKYKSAKRYHDDDKLSHREACTKDISQLEQKLSQHLYLMGDQLSLVDYAVLPFIRQFSRVERRWYLSSPYPKLKLWLKSHLESPLYSTVMTKHPLWSESNEDVIFGSNERM